MDEERLRAERRTRIESVGYDYAAAPKHPVGPCNLCGGVARRPLTEADRYGFPVVAQGCERCGLVFLDPMLSRDAYSAFYERWYRPLVSAYHGRRIDAETLPDDQRRYARSLVDWLAEQWTSPPPASWLDIGGSTGVVAAALRDRFGGVATVLDPSPSELAVAARLGLETAAGFVEDYTPSPGTRFEAITLCQTADHLLDLADALERARGWLRESGWFFVDIVDYRAVARAQGALERAIKLDHPYSLSDATLRAYLARAGFEVRATRRGADLHLDYLCTPCTPRPDALPDTATVTELWNELA